jgi:hypothetical protein
VVVVVQEVAAPWPETTDLVAAEQCKVAPRELASIQEAGLQGATVASMSSQALVAPLQHSPLKEAAEVGGDREHITFLYIRSSSQSTFLRVASDMPTPDHNKPFHSCNIISLSTRPALLSVQCKI